MTPRRLAWAAMVMLAGVTGLGLAAQPRADSREVRQIVTFRFLPGQTTAALDLYRNGVLPIYRNVEAMRTVRFLGEVESPEPLDLVVVTHYADMAGMDRANRAMTERPPEGPSLGQLYRQIGDLSLGHYDQFVEVISPPETPLAPDRLLEVLEFVRVRAGSGSYFERQVLEVVHPWEAGQEMRSIVARSETARFLVSDGWDYLRVYGMRDLAAWQAYVTARARHPAANMTFQTAELRKTVILRELADLRVR